MTLPGLLVIGAQKAGTSWLHENLAQHPGIWVPPFKELHFFDHKFIPENRKWTHAHVERGVEAALARLAQAPSPDPARKQWLERIRERPMFNRSWYRQVFSACPDGRVGLDVTPEYCCVPPEGIAFMDAFLPGARYVYVIRHPVTRALSQLRMNAARRRQPPETPEDWMALAHDPVIRHRGNYSRYIRQWDAALGPDRLRYIAFGRIAAEPLAVLRDVEDFAGLPPARYRDIDRPVFASLPRPVPAGVRAYFEERLAPQTEFLRARFGDAFFAAC